MVMNFWEAQRQAKTKTIIYLTIFILLTLAAGLCAELAMRAFAGDSYGNPPMPYVGLGFLGVTFGVAAFNYMNYLQSGGSYVAESVGAELVNPYTRDPKERQLLNIVEEIALATSLPVPPVYILEAQEINAFAAGTSPENAAITVTRGCLMTLKRDELQGVLAHEFGHIYNRDMTIGMRVAAMIMGFFIVSYIGLRLLESASYGGYSRRNDEDRKGGNPILLIALIFLIAGALTWFFGSILQAMVSRQREYLADACSVQYTRNPIGIANALRKIQRSVVSDMPRSGQPFSHLYFNEHPSFWERLFATHPPIEKRIAAIEGGEYREAGDFPSSENSQQPPPPPPLG
ncbi:M48 family metallopeptidase [Candidatus Protochlamydia phocaeensis]|uniref:M48 family metallopeptidase n=1 Tax=Candidatus Protochlamydia phocaeensis TaxID=1414722 RepID=UPI000AA3A50A|nr:M48 family metallopeptidase [Candidatus Protochlamydia phocaeensis]